MHRPSASRIGGSARRARGYALVIVLWVLAGLTVVAVSVASNVRSQALGISQLRARIEAERAFLSTASRIKVIGHQAQRLSAELHGARGKLHLDGRLTLVPNAPDQLVLQDAAGLIALRADARGCPACCRRAERLRRATMCSIGCPWGLCRRRSLEAPERSRGLRVRRGRSRCSSQCGAAEQGRGLARAGLGRHPCGLGRRGL
jgi:hypothetical protein